MYNHTAAVSWAGLGSTWISLGIGYVAVLWYYQVILARLRLIIFRWDIDRFSKTGELVCQTSAVSDLMSGTVR